MILTTAAFVSGVLLLQYQSSLPGLLLAPLLLPLLLFVAWRYRSRLPVRLTATLLGGFLWASMMAHIALQPDLPEGLQGQDLHAVGVVESLPDLDARRTRFLFQIERLSDGERDYPSPGRVRLNWYRDAPPLSPGDRWRLTVRLKRPHGMANPGVVDYERTLFQKGIRATGYIREDARNGRLDTLYAGYLFQRLRQMIGARIDATLPAGQSVGLVRALVIGDRSKISRDEWTLFRRTGTNHLVAISGLHIGIVSSLGFFLGGWLWRRSATLCSLLPAPQAAAFAALVCGFCYAGLAGFAIPCLRALVMLAAVLGGLFFRRLLHPSRSLCIALWSILLLDPVSVLSTGFWLSFGAVAVIMLGVLGRSGFTTRPLPALFRVQWVVALGLAPLLLLLGLDLPLVSPLVNLLVVPLFSLFMVPFTLLSVLLLMLWSAPGAILLTAAAWLLGQTESLLAMVAAHGETLSLSGTPPSWMLLGLLLSILLLLLPAGIPGRWLGTLLLCPLLLYRPPQPSRGEVWMTMLDVGQGLAIVLETSEHVLLYDTGPRFPSGFNTGDAVVLPFLRSRGVERVDRIIVTNGDVDHRGGLAAVLHSFPGAQLLSGEPRRISSGEALRCSAGMRWVWDGVTFEILHPDGSARWRGNNASCVLAVRTAAGQLLLTGDIEAEAEMSLVKQFGKRLLATAVTVPHHGSAGSSDARFISATAPRYALVSSGYQNRYGFPQGGGSRALASTRGGYLEYGRCRGPLPAPGGGWRD